MSALDISTVKWVVDTIINMKNSNEEDHSLWLTTMSNVDSLYNNFAGLLKADIEGRGGDVICSNQKKHLVSFRGAFFTIILETNTESVNFKIVQYYNP